MPKIYFAHSTSFDFKNELYSPIRKSNLNSKYQFILPHEKSSDQFNSKELIQTFDYVFAEVSYPSTGLGIELGWPNRLDIPIVAFYKSGSKISGSMYSLTKNVIEYKDGVDLIEKMEAYLKKLF